MSESTRIEGDRVYCHPCHHEWPRAEGGLQCPECGSEFVEIVESDTRPRTDDFPDPERVTPSLSRSPSRPNPFHDHNPFPDPDEDDITTYQFNTNNGRGTFSFTSRTYTFGGDRRNVRDPAAADVGRNLESMLEGFMGFHNSRRPQPVMGGGMFQFPPQHSARDIRSQPGRPPDLFSMLFPEIQGQQRQANQALNPLDFLSAILNPGSAQHGDMVFSQEAFDRVMTQLMEQNQASGAPGPASEAAINSLKKKKVDGDMMGSDGKAECSICMDGVEIDDEVTTLPCNHWFHGECVVSWLKEHDTCPHCRQPITAANETNQQASSPSRRRTSRRSSSIASPLSSHNNTASTHLTNDTPSGLREARQRYYGSRRESDYDRPSSERRPSSRSDRNPDNGNGGGVGGWIRSHMPFT